MSSEAGAVFAFEPLESALSTDDTLRDLGEIERLRLLAHMEGEAAGRAAGLAAAEASAAPILASIGAVLSEIETARARVADEVERDAVELALALAAQICAGVVEVRPERVLDVVRGVLRRIGDRRRLMIVVNPEDVALVEEALAGIQGELGSIEHVQVSGDRRVERGGALVHTSDGAIDAQIAAQIERARAVVAAELSEG